MNKEEAKQKLHNLAFAKLDTKPDDLKLADVMQIVNQIDEPQAGHAEEAPRYVKNILARLRELPLHDREVWLEAIMGEFDEDFSHAKWREGYEQGKFEGAWVGNQLKNADKIRQELNNPVVPQFVADWYEDNKDDFEGNLFRCAHNIPSIFDGAKLNEFERWFINASTKPFQILVNMHQFGYKVEKEKRYIVKMKGVHPGSVYLKRQTEDDYWYFGVNSESECIAIKHTRKELEGAGFGEVFNNPMFEVEEVKG